MGVVHGIVGKKGISQHHSPAGSGAWNLDDHFPNGIGHRFEKPKMLVKTPGYQAFSKANPDQEKHSYIYIYCVNELISSPVNMCFLDSNRSSHLTNGLPQGFFWLREPSFGAAVGGHSIPCAISWCDRRPWQALDSCQDTALAFGIKDCEAAVSRCLLVAGFHLNWHLQGLLPCLHW